MYSVLTASVKNPLKSCRTIMHILSYLGIKNIVRSTHVNKYSNKISEYIYVFKTDSDKKIGETEITSLREIYNGYYDTKNIKNTFIRNLIKNLTNTDTVKWNNIDIKLNINKEKNTVLFSIANPKAIPLAKIRISDHSNRNTRHRSQDINEIGKNNFFDINNDLESISRLVKPMVELSVNVSAKMIKRFKLYYVKKYMDIKKTSTKIDKHTFKENVKLEFIEESTVKISNIINSHLTIVNSSSIFKTFDSILQFNII